MKSWTIAIGVIACVMAILFARHGRAPIESAVVLRNVIAKDDVHVDVYLPSPGKPAPWVVFADESMSPGFGEALQRRGIAAVLISVATRQGENEEGGAERIAAVVREIARRTMEYGLAPNPVLIGNEAGASLVSLLALDRHFDLQPASVGGVVAMNGVYDGALRHVRADTPPFLVLSAHGDSPDSAQRARSFSRALEQAGATNVRSFHVIARDARTLADLSGERNDVADLLASFVRGDAWPGGPESAWAVADVWGAGAPLSTEPFWADEGLIVRRPVDDGLRAQIGRVFAGTMRDLEPWPCRTYDTIDLGTYLGAHPELGTGDWVVITNARGEELVLSRAEIERRRPVIVVGIDDEKNLFRLLVTYNVYRTFSFRPETAPRPLLARPVGAFLHFAGPVSAPPIATFADFALTPSSFRVVANDPLSELRSLPKPLLRTLTAEQGCLQCHSMRGSGARSHHLRALDGQPAGGDALALEEYPRDVLQRFLFDQDEVAQVFGVAPIPVDREVANQMLDALTP